MARIVVGMSGGADSSAAAAILRDEGHDVVGVTLHLWDYDAHRAKGRCCAPEDQHDARRVCDALGIPHFTFDRRWLFRERVVEPFIDGYLRGLTPSPCVRCNESVKLGPLWEIARRLGATQVATGHYAHIEVRDGEVVLERAHDADRDQSYFLFAAPLDALRSLVLPLGSREKPDVRSYLEHLGLSVARKPDSTDLCFVEGQDYAEWVAGHATQPLPPPGSIETTDGRTIGTHDGIHRYTVGQRRAVPGVDGRARYVLSVVPERNAVVVGTDVESRSATVHVGEVRWFVANPPTRVNAKLRYRHAGVEADVRCVAPGVVELQLDEPQRGVAPGQAAVLYVGDRVVGGGFIVGQPANRVAHASGSPP